MKRVVVLEESTVKNANDYKLFGSDTKRRDIC